MLETWKGCDFTPEKSIWATVFVLEDRDREEKLFTGRKWVEAKGSLGAWELIGSPASGSVRRPTTTKKA
jgi:hypothetical protein